ncbi:hypothetical protein FSP39_021157 [Pinctada imbricata]|uniref:Uncharacterized protein n=1 Tax=Pinctada imbricata TaxID=66713 RepID=A0AA88XXT5_PINIB|nr:hypothetical protein FSP39_021157 [Pinctada imbricata]
MVVGLRHPCRCIRQIWLLKGGQQFRIVTFSPISIGRHFKKIIDVPLKDVSGQVARDPNVKSIPIKVKGFKRPFLLDNKSGTFHNVKLYDYTIGQKAKFR